MTQDKHTIEDVLKMDKAVNALGYELPAEVWNDVHEIWNNLKASLNRQGCRWDGELKNILVVCDHDENYQIWSKYKYEKYIRGCVEVGGGSAYRIVTHFNGNESSQRKL